MSGVSKTQFEIGVILLAAGSSRRMGRPKLLLPWGTTTVLGHLIQQWIQLGAHQIAVVTPPDSVELTNELDRLGVAGRDRIVNPDPGRGMFSSIRCAAAWSGWKPELTHWGIALGDQPHLRMETLERLIEFGAAHPDTICQPLRNGRPKHPVLLPKRVFLEINRSAASDLRQFLERHAPEPAGFESDDAGLDFDMDTPADYERARRGEFS
jgi:molybdenum cofactor cytidylyltransferase